MERYEGVEMVGAPHVAGGESQMKEDLVRDDGEGRDCESGARSPVSPNDLEVEGVEGRVGYDDFVGLALQMEVCERGKDGEIRLENGARRQVGVPTDSSRKACAIPAR